MDNLYTKTRLKVGASYTQQKIRIAICKIWHVKYCLEIFEELKQENYIELSMRNGLHDNFDYYTIKKDFYNGKKD